MVRSGVGWTPLREHGASSLKFQNNGRETIWTKCGEFNLQVYPLNLECFIDETLL